MDVTTAAQPVINDDPGHRRFAARLAEAYALLAVDRLSDGRVEDALYLASWKKALTELADGHDVKNVALPPIRPVNTV